MDDMLTLDVNNPGLGIEPGHRREAPACYPLDHKVI